MTDKEKELWQQCIAFHGHACPGLAVGFKAALKARELLDCDGSPDEEVVCISENDACGVDAIQVLLGCTAGKGNLLFHIRGKMAWSFYNRRNGRSIRLVQKDGLEHKDTLEEKIQLILDTPARQLFEMMAPTLPLPQPAKTYKTYQCARCGEKTGEKWIRLVDGQTVCLDCLQEADRFNYE
jgi:formylmethanofuran dehydrogenase subunit E